MSLFSNPAHQSVKQDSFDRPPYLASNEFREP
jgi:hypothetical protein